MHPMYMVDGQSSNTFFLQFSVHDKKPINLVIVSACNCFKKVYNLFSFKTAVLELQNNATITKNKQANKQTNKQTNKQVIQPRKTWITTSTLIKMHFSLHTFIRKGHSEMDKCTQKHHHLQQLHCSTTYVPCSLFYPAETQTPSALTKSVLTCKCKNPCKQFYSHSGLGVPP